MNDSLRYLIKFLTLFLIFYGFNIAYIAITSPGGIYSSFLDEHFNYINIWRSCYISTTAKTLELFDFTVHTTNTSLKVQGRSGFRLVYSCLGYGIMSCFSAFALSFPKPILLRITFLFSGITIIFTLNLCRFILLSLFYNPDITILATNHHDIFNGILYLIILLMMNKWVNS